MSHDPQALQLDVNAMFAEQVGPEAGLTREDLQGLCPQLEEAVRLVEGREGPSKEFLGFLDLPFQPKEAIQAVKDEADRLAALGDRHLVLGIGGSYLGARAILEALGHPYRNELPRQARNGRPRIYFEGNNLDGDAMLDLLDMLPKAGPVGLEDGLTLNVISKSGGTVETAVAFRIFRERIEAIYGPKAKDHITATTDVAKGTLKKLADDQGYQTFVIPDDVGGRYSVLTPVGLLPAAIAGVDVFALVAGAKAMAERCQGSDPFKNPALMYAALQHLSEKKGRNVSIMAAWAKKLEFLAFWYDQLCAESLGKDGQGRLPLSSVNSRDLHARGQQVQDGPRHTVVTNLQVLKGRRALTVRQQKEDADGLNYLAGWEMDAMQKGALEGTRYAYAKDGRPSMTLTFPELNAHTLGQAFYFFELATLYEGRLMGINPLDQPGVEAYKKFMFANLGRADMAAAKAEFDARPQENPGLVL